VLAIILVAIPVAAFVYDLGIQDFLKPRKGS
jgi:hypothetical protein